MSKAKQMGTQVETWSVNYLRANGFPAARREVLHGGQDHGDLVLAPGLIAECKRAQRGLQLTAWRRELDKEIANAGAQYGILIMKPAGAGAKSAHRFIGGMGGEAFVRLRGHVLPQFQAGLISVNLGRCYGRPERLYANAAKTGAYLTKVSDYAYHAIQLPSVTGIMMPFASIVRPGGDILNEFDNVVIGPLWQFVLMLRAYGYGEAL